MPSLQAYCLTLVSLTLDMGYLFTAAPGKWSRCSWPWMWGITSQPPLLRCSTAAADPALQPPLASLPLSAQSPCPLSAPTVSLGFLYLFIDYYNIMDIILCNIHHQLDGREFGWTLGVGDGHLTRGGLTCCNSWGRKESDTTEQLNWTEHTVLPCSSILCIVVCIC